MNPQGQIPRSRGGITGVLLILLGLWGGLAPFVGPYFHFGFTPDSAWQYNSGRLYYSIIPGAAALLGGLLVVGTRSRAVGIAAGLLAALGGAWFALGQGFMTIVLKHTSVSVGRPIVASSAGLSVQLRQYLETIGLFGGLGLLVLFCGALAVGRFSMLAARDVADQTDSYYPGFPAATTASTPDLSQYPAASDLGQYPTSPDVGQYQSATGQFPAPSQPQAPFPAAPSPFPDTMTSQFQPPDATS
jgi:hypothetical protein